jgi:hypothetical protein
MQLNWLKRMRKKRLILLPLIVIFLVGAYLFLGNAIAFNTAGAPKITGLEFSNSTNEGLYKTGDSIKILATLSDPFFEVLFSPQSHDFSFYLIPFG